MTTIMVFVMVFVASIFFLLADQVMRVARELPARHQRLSAFVSRPNSRFGFMT